MVRKRPTHTKLWLGIGLFTFVLLGILYIFFIRGFLAGYGPAPALPQTDNDSLDSVITLPKGFHIAYYAQNVTDARSLVVAQQNAVFVGTRKAGNVYALRDFDGDKKAEKIFTIAQGLDNPNGVAFDGKDLYITTTGSIYSLKDIVAHTGLVPPLKKLPIDLPHAGGHDWRYTAFGPDGKLYIGIGVPCNVCKEQDPYATIARVNKNGSDFTVIQRGIRNTVGFDWDQSGTLWFTDNGRDWLGDNAPGDELNAAPIDEMHFGFPYCHQGNVSDPEFGDERLCNEFTEPQLTLGPHVAALGMAFAQTTVFPTHYQQGIFIAEHGSWNRKEPLGYRIMFVPFKNGKPVGYEVFAEGWLVGSNAWGRPVAVAFLPDGSLLVSDDKHNAIYRITYGENT